MTGGRDLICFVLVASEGVSLNEWLSEPFGLLIRPRLCYAMDSTGQIRFSVVNHGGFPFSNPSFER